VWNRAVAEGIVTWRPGSEDPAAIELMAKLSAKSRERWPVEELPETARLPGVLPAGNGEAAAGA
jgi:hypothetical protein